MTEEFKKQIEMQARQAVTELLAEAKLKKGDVPGADFALDDPAALADWIENQMPSL